MTQIDIGQIIEQTVRKHFDDTTLIARRRGEETIAQLPPELRLEATAELEHMLDWDNQSPASKQRLREEHLLIANALLPLIREAIVAPIRAKIEANELYDLGHGEWVAAGLISTDELRELIGEQR